ncbi:SARP family transcriptional regulator [Paractinoplanes abujensis]|uniref:DNA-binding SARP family transcriptional activator/tetratricopeptide (TPR) repeat protein n=1 Tax=Paractinoplanes abujensis TaxID=882441 RepID=A0A7W7CR52_9ACTN|nr:BTAD domain-containing putative transcriptional regulator [Actinoplanes abujensis]MBB4692899.1 DNA-binding SARP family transcriptional activator/tetratricopeptide (TPR) repeat protein [Actinoplanes abujensis]GID22601.1 SARP family transcriptional regulator [Actinoplanes abujensis]
MSLVAGSAVLEVRLLGPVELWAGSRPLPVGEPRQRAVLAALACDAGRVVTAETLIDRVWGEAAPARARHTLQSHLARVRAALRRGGDDPLVRRSGGYLLDLPADRVDLLRFRALTEQARGDLGRLREAVGLWRGEPLAGLAGDWAASMRAAWDSERLVAVVAWAEAELAAGDPVAVIGPLSTIVQEQPFVEPVTVALMRALHAIGRTADALGQYEALRRRLADELGADPAPATQAAHAAVLTSNGNAATGTVEPVPDEPVPAQLPADVTGFAGRAEALAALDKVPSLAVIGGSAGVGKTALAVHWAHRAAGRFPDGQLYVDLRGFGPSGAARDRGGAAGDRGGAAEDGAARDGAAMDPGEAVRGFLGALGVPAPRIPAEAAAQSALLRSRLAGKRIVLVLDNARDSDQVRPLLPGAGSCVTVVTSRNQLTGLVAADGAHPLRLDVLSQGEARELLDRRLGPDRTAAEPGAGDAIIDLCAGLPLALTLAVAHAVMQPALGLATLADGLAGTRQRWSTLTGDTPGTDVRAVFSWSYEALSPAAARLFRLLGAHPGPDFAPAAVEHADELSELVRSSLITEHTPGRYRLHDLMQAYAEELETDPAARDEATARLFGHYLGVAAAGALLLAPARLAPVLPIEPAAGLTDAAAAMRWFAAERAVLLAWAARTGGDRPWQVAWTLDTYLYRQGPWHDLVTVWEAALATVRNEPARAYAHYRLARAWTLLERPAEADRHYGLSLEVYERAGDAPGQSQVHHEMAILRERQGRMRDALTHAERALELSDHAVVNTLNTIGFYRAQLGDFAGALEACEQALALCDDSDDDIRAAIWDSLGFIRHGLGEHDAAVACYETALALYRRIGDLYWVADTLVHLGDTHRDTGRSARARAAWQEALSLFEELGHAHAAEVRSRLS